MEVAEALAGCLAVLAAELPQGAVELGLAVRTALSRDRSAWADGEIAGAVIRPSHERDVALTLAAAARYGVPVVPRGAGTGLSGGAGAIRDCIVLDLAGMGRILEIEPNSRYAVVEPGVITADLDRAAAEHGLSFAPDPASAALSTVGGNIATNAGGLRCVKFGTTRQAVLGLRVALSTGEIVELGGRTKKNVTGLDLLGLVVGSEGTLGVVVQATVALVPRPLGQQTIAIGCSEWDQVQRCVLAIATSGVTPSLMELMDRGALHRRDPATAARLGISGEPVAILLVQTDGLGSREEMERIISALADTAAQIAGPLSSDDARYAIALRRGETLPGFDDPQVAAADDEWWLGEDMTVPAAHLAEYFRAAETIATEVGIGMSLVAHVGDGNLHPSLTVTKGRMTEEAARAALATAADRLIRLAVSLGGTLTGEHGIGVLKRPWIPLVLAPAVLELHRGVKAVFDPSGVMNPGRAY